MSMPKVVVAGQGYVGLPVAMRAVDVGFDVVGLDVDESRVDALRSGKSFIGDVAADHIASAIASGRYKPTASAADCEGFDFALITVPTPLREGVPDLSYVEAAGRMIAPHVKPGSTVVLESTTYPGTTEEFLVPLLEAGSGLQGGSDFFVGYSPERIDVANPGWTFQNTPKVVAGVNAPSLDRVRWLYQQLVDTPVTASSVRTAELTKLLENTFRHVNIALVNELAVFSHELGVDVWEAIEAASTKPFGFMPFYPGPGVGGHCLPIDPSYLSWRVRRSLGHNFRFIELANDVNDHMPDYVVRRLTVGLNGRGLAVKGSRILLLGIAYKRNTGDTREAPARVIADRLMALGAAVYGCDPHVEGADLPFPLVEATREELAAADAVILITDHAAFRYDSVVEEARYILDCRGLMRGANVERL